MIRGAPGGVKERMRLSGRVNFLEQREMGPIHALVHQIALEGEHKIDVARRIGQSALPQTLGIRRTFPLAAVVEAGALCDDLIPSSR